MHDVIALQQRLMDYWQLALEEARSTGYWKDVEACTSVLLAFHSTITDALNSGQFSGDAKQALGAWENVGRADAEYRAILEREARLVAPVADPRAWWNVLDVSPSASPDATRQAYLEKLKRCHPDRVAGLDSQIVALAEKMSKRLTRAFEQSQGH